MCSPPLFTFLFPFSFSPDFCMKYAQEAWDTEHISWCTIIQLSVIHSIITIVEVLQAEMDGELINVPSTPLMTVSHTPTPATTASAMFLLYSPLSRPGDSPTVTTSFRADTPMLTAPSSSLHALALRASSSSTFLVQHASGKHLLSTPLTGKHQVLKMQLGPLQRVETDLKQWLGAGADKDMGLGIVGMEGEGMLGLGVGLMLAR